VATRNMVHVGRDRIQISPWKNSRSIANLVPFPARDALSHEAVHRTVEEALGYGFRSAYTAALSPNQAEPFIAAGFTLFEELHLLRCPITSEMKAERGRTRRARKTDWDDVLTLDALAFEDFWQFDRSSLADAIQATPRHRFHVIKSTPVMGYHVTGLGGTNAYVQRVAVHPDAQGRGLGRVLMNDSLRWAWRNGATMAQVNTQITNERAVALYERCGFTLAPYRLHVLHADFSVLAGHAVESLDP
jgi:GNAT superfamily N-acetyltransferase